MQNTSIRLLALSSLSCGRRRFRNTEMTRISNAISNFVSFLTIVENFIKKKRDPSIFEQRLIWETIFEKHGSRANFKRHLHISPKSFHKLLSYVKKEFEVDAVQANHR
jgi:hypothetical protein